MQVVNLDNELTSVDLGVIDFCELQALDLSGGVRGYSFEATRSGILTAEAVAQVDDVLVELALF